jgi:uncharacterized protein YgbK (DUF1537 family)
VDLLYTFYGDDFTGSTDVLEQLATNGIPAVLFLGAPTPGQLAAFSDVRAIGIAGDSRSRSPEWMSENLPAVFRLLQGFDAPVTHYKVCSTFDSAPTHGSIGRAIEIGMEVFGPGLVPIVVGAPHLRRYVVFGNLFAATPDGSIQRIDRHPMSRHPVTPMREADLRIHLGKQTELEIRLVDLVRLQSGEVSEFSLNSGAVLFDTIDLPTQGVVGDVIWREACRRALFSASSSGFTGALISAWRNLGLLRQSATASPIEARVPLLVVSGSCSLMTERQIRWALAHGYVGIAINPQDLVRSCVEAIESAAAALRGGLDTVIYTALGDPGKHAYGDTLGTALGRLLGEVIAGTGVRRVLLCGGDTSSHAVQQLGLYALTWVANLQPGAPLCRAHADGPLDGLELVLKGGQVGSEDFFDVVRGGR